MRSFILKVRLNLKRIWDHAPEIISIIFFLVPSCEPHTLVIANEIISGAKGHLSAS